MKVRTDWAHTPVSMLGKIFSTLRLPAKSANDFSDRSAATNVKSGATWPIAGKLPFVEIRRALKSNLGHDSVLVSGGKRWEQDLE